MNVSLPHARNRIFRHIPMEFCGKLIACPIATALFSRVCQLNVFIVGTWIEPSMDSLVSVRIHSHRFTAILRTSPYLYAILPHFLVKNWSKPIFLVRNIIRSRSHSSRIFSLVKIYPCSLLICLMLLSLRWHRSPRRRYSS